MNGLYLFKPVLVEDRMRRLKEEGADVDAIGSESSQEAEIQVWNAKQRAERRERALQDANGAAGSEEK